MEDHVLIVPMTKNTVIETSHGEMKIHRRGYSYVLTYHNHLYKNSPFEMPTKFSIEFTIGQIMASNEVLKFMERFK